MAAHNEIQRVVEHRGHLGGGRERGFWRDWVLSAGFGRGGKRHGLGLIGLGCLGGPLMLVKGREAAARPRALKPL
eukprot:CAMPEP_0184340294 /NCGR_PEP_ID=MMETSP1089-20130417/8968_1 /TAXON_ID=38269 ORGANISM="Gloeochaete wittrockiana, Strain SAG46.84" /NCGR_SAMPLE_ID=MMETSP1089 /ASSEMBLY_ACC=CAM_ASM_000445 /LENGTH=74 /DNA_ID=CAMNT_0026668033 /DNA_START=998 /DNA_END=1222 /DNA_ORIENTATION=+